MRAFFVQPSGHTNGMRVIRHCGFLFAILHLGAILLARTIPLGRSIFAVAVYVCSLGLFWWAIQVNAKAPLSAAFSTDPPDHLVQHGPYRYVRHPFYCSYLLAWSGGVIASAQWWLAATVGVMLAIYLHAAILEERKFLRSALAVEYKGYRDRTGLLMPNPVKALDWRRSRTPALGTRFSTAEGASDRERSIRMALRPGPEEWRLDPLQRED